MGSAARISNYASVGVSQLISMYSRLRGNLVPLLPVILSITPNAGPQTAGTMVRILGYNFEGVSSVTIGGAVCTGLINGGGIITCYAPSGSGLQALAVTGPAGTMTLANAFQYAAAFPVPTVTSVSTSGGAVGDIAGGYPMTITGTGFTGATGVTIGGTAATSVVVVSSTSITCTVPAHATGNGVGSSVLVTTPGGTNSANALFRFFSPAELALTGWWRSSYGGAPWAGNASAGVSGTTGALVAGVAPSTGTALNSLTPATMNGTTQYLVNATQLSTLFTAGNGSIVCLYKPAAAKTAQSAGSEYLDPYCFGDNSNGGLALTYSSAGFKAVFYSGGYITVAKASAVSTPALAMMRWNSTNLGLTVSNTSEVTTAAGAFSISLAQTPSMGASYSQTGILQGDMFEVLSINSYLSNQNYADLRSYTNTRYFPAGAQV